MPISTLQSAHHHVKQRVNRRLNGFIAPKNLDSICDIDLNEIPAENPAVVDNLWARMQGMYHCGMHPFISLAIRHKGELIFNRSIGYARMNDDLSSGELVGNINTPVCLFSASKPISAMLVHKLVEQGLVNLLLPVSHYLPDFGKNGKENISLYQMLTHRSGFAFIDQDIDPSIVVDLDRIFELICDLPCANSDGRVVAYHGVTTGFVIAKLVQELTGKTIREYLDEEIRKPMGMTNFDYGYHNTADTPVAHNYNTGGPRFGLFIDHLTRTLGIPFEEIVELSNTPLFHEGVVPSGNAFCTAEEASRFYQMLLDNGMYQGKQIFKAESVNIAAQEAGPATFDRGLCIPMRFSPAFMLGGNPAGMYGRNTHHAFGHLGLSNVITFADPQRDLAVAFMSNGKPVIGTHLIQFLRLMFSVTSSFEAKQMR